MGHTKLWSVCGILAASSLIQNATATNVVSMSTFKGKRVIASGPLRRLGERATITSELDLSEQDNVYFMNLTIGTPGQTVTLQIDTGSSDTWVNSPKSCANGVLANGLTCIGGIYDSTASSTFTSIEKGTANFTYQDGSGASGDYFTDDVMVGNAKLHALEMGVAQDSTVNYGLVGLGFYTIEANVSKNNGQPFPTIVDSLWEQKLISSRTYSIWLNDLEAQVGSILFGGVDTGKFVGGLTTLPISPDQNSGNIDSMSVTFTSLAINDQNYNPSITDFTPSPSFAISAVLDTGTTFSYLDPSVAQPLIDYVGAVPDTNFGYVVPCNLTAYPATINFGFGGPSGVTIAVPIAELTQPIFAPYPFPDGSQACIWGLQPSSDTSPNILGDTFMRSAYVVYDLDNLQISLGQTAFNSTTSNVVEIPGPIPNAGSNSSAAAPTRSATSIFVIPSQTAVATGVRATQTILKATTVPVPHRTSGVAGKITARPTTVAGKGVGGATSTAGAKSTSSSKAGGMPVAVAEGGFMAAVVMGVNALMWFL